MKKSSPHFRTQGQIRMLHDDVISTLALLQEGAADAGSGEISLCVRAEVVH